MAPYTHPAPTPETLSLGVLLVEFRAGVNMPTVAAAREIGITRAHLYWLEIGVRRPSDGVLSKIIAVYGLNSDQERRLTDARIVACGQPRGLWPVVRD